MKCILAIVLAFFMLGLSACGVNTAVQTITSSVDNNISAQACQAIPTFVSLEDYYEYISEGIDPGSFITYDMIKEFGTFVSFVDYGSQKCTEYLYGLIDSNGYVLNLHICETNKELRVAEGLRLLEQHNRSDLRSIQEKGYLITEHASYYYNSSGLSDIVWETNTHRFRIRAGRVEMLSDYPAEKTTLLTQLLNAETAEAAVAEFNAKVAQARQEAQAEKAD